MKQSDAVQFLFRDLKVVTSDLVLDQYDQVFEEEMREYFPFNEAIMGWLQDLYSSEKYGAFDEENLTAYFEKDHPFLFIRDLAHINCWNKGMERKDRQDHITGLMYSENPSYALESTLSLCRPSLIGKPASSWFDFKQAMTNLEKADPSCWKQQAWKACSMFYLYFNLSETGQTIDRDDLMMLLEPYENTLETAVHEGDKSLRNEVSIVKRMTGTSSTRTMMDGLKL